MGHLACMQTLPVNKGIPHSRVVSNFQFQEHYFELHQHNYVKFTLDGGHFINHNFLNHWFSCQQLMELHCQYYKLYTCMSRGFLLREMEGEG